MGQAPGDGEELAFMEMGNMSINCPDAIIEAFHFENLKIKVTTSDFFKFKTKLSMYLLSLGRTVKSAIWYVQCGIRK